MYISLWVTHLLAFVGGMVFLWFAIGLWGIVAKAKQTRAGMQILKKIAESKGQGTPQAQAEAVVQQLSKAYQDQIKAGKVL